MGILKTLFNSPAVSTVEAFHSHPHINGDEFDEQFQELIEEMNALKGDYDKAIEIIARYEDVLLDLQTSNRLLLNMNHNLTIGVKEAFVRDIERRAAEAERDDLKSIQGKYDKGS